MDAGDDVKHIRTHSLSRRGGMALLLFFCFFANTDQKKIKSKDFMFGRTTFTIGFR